MVPGNWIAEHISIIRLLDATPEDENPADLLQAAARDHIPLNPNKPKIQEITRDVPDPQHRPTIEDVISDLQEQEWYTDQISHRRVFEAKPGQNGRCTL